MPARLDVTGMRYGRLVAIESIGRQVFPSGQSRTMWLFQCDCGNTTRKTLFDVRARDTLSCGCLKKENIRKVVNKLPFGQASFNAKYESYKRSAKYRNLEWNLTKETFRKIVESCCYYCGLPPLNVYIAQKEKVNGGITVNGIDRVDNSIGYEVENCVPCCVACNRGKGAMLQSDFLGWIKRVYEHSNQRDAS